MRRRIARGLTLLPALLVLSGCGLPVLSVAPTPPPHPGRSADPAALAAREAVKPDPNFDFGQTVQITSDGFHPASLVAMCCQSITWKNLTAAPVTVTLDRLNVNSGPIPPGGSFVWTPPNMQSVTYHADRHPEWHGQIQVNQTFES